MNNYSTIEELLINEGFDLTNSDLTDINLIRSNLSNVKLPKDKNLFQKIKNKSLFGVTLPHGDYSYYNFDGVNITSVTFTPDSKLPKDRDFFKKIFRKELYGTVLPTIDMNDYDFDGVYIAGAVFTRNTIFSTNTDFFQIIHNKNIYKTVLPVHDYSPYNFNDVNVVAANFQEDSKFELENNIFQKVRDKSFIATILPEDLIKKIQYYDLTDVDIDLNEYKLSLDTLALIKCSQPNLCIKIKGEFISQKRDSQSFIISKKP